MTRWHGIYPSTVLPMREDFAPDWAAYATHTAACGLYPGIAGVLCNGHAGENTLIASAEKRQVVQETVRTLNGRGRVVAGVNAESSLDAAREAADAMAAGAEAVMVFAPNGFALSQDDEMAVRHHRLIAAAIPGAPMFLFQGAHTAGRMAYSPQVLDRLLDLPDLVGIKEGGWEVNRYDALRRQVRARRPDMVVLASGDEHLLAAMAHGSDGSMVSLASIVPGDILALDAAMRASDLSTARAVHERIEPLAEAIYGLAPPGRATARLKWCLHALGRIPCPAVRPPVGPVSKDEAAILGAALRTVRARMPLAAHAGP